MVISPQAPHARRKIETARACNNRPYNKVTEAFWRLHQHVTLAGTRPNNSSPAITTIMANSG